MHLRTFLTGVGNLLPKLQSPAAVAPVWQQLWVARLRQQTSVAHQAGPSFATSRPSIHSLSRLKYLFSVGAAATLAANTDAEHARLAYLIPTRLARDVYTAIYIVADYKLSLRNKEGAECEDALLACHKRSASRLRDLCFRNGGIYIKLGQHIAQMDHVMPGPYVEIMRDNLLNRCPLSSIEEVRHVFKHDFGAFPEQLYAKFDPVPIASASLAQVHVAHDHSGRKLAVKVQHPSLRETYHADIATIQALVSAVKMIVPEFDYQWLVDEIKHNLPLELDFKHEVQNAKRCRANLSSSKSRVGSRVHIPEVMEELVSHRVLTMEFIEGAPVTDKKALMQMGIVPRDLARLVSETFNEMIFIHGDVHCDPHAANLLVRKQDGQMQLVLLDHGLYRQIDDDFRAEYAALWRALIFADVEGIKRHSEGMNAGEAYHVFAMMLTQRPWENVQESSLDHLVVKDTAASKAIAAQFAARHGKDISDILVRMPRPLLLLLKTNDCLRSVDTCLGAPVNTFVITARECTRALSDIKRMNSPGVASYLSSWVEAARVEIRMGVMHALVWMSGWTRGAYKTNGVVNTTQSIKS